MPHGIQELFQLRESKYNLRGTCIFNKPSIRTNTKLHCITTKAVSLWNNCNDELKKYTTMSKLKKTLQKKNIELLWAGAVNFCYAVFNLMVFVRLFHYFILILSCRKVLICLTHELNIIDTDWFILKIYFLENNYKK